MRTFSQISGKTAGGLLASTLLAVSLSTVTHAANTTISGTPLTTVMATRYYGFQAWATDGTNTAVTYAISNKPKWATFDSKYGHLSGIPAAGDVGKYSNISIWATDGRSSAYLPAFSITVTSNGSTSTSGGGTTSGGTTSGGTTSSGGTGTTGAATVNWHPPTQNTNGSTITNLAGYVINYGTNSKSLTQQVKVSNPGITSYMIGGLTKGTYYFAVSAYNSAGVVSALSGMGSKTIK
jgi:hypothetical protein